MSNVGHVWNRTRTAERAGRVSPPVSQCIGGEREVACPTDPGECGHEDLNPTPADSCEKCLREVGDHRMVLDSGEDDGAVYRACNYPSGCDGDGDPVTPPPQGIVGFPTQPYDP